MIVRTMKGEPLTEEPLAPEFAAPENLGTVSMIGPDDKAVFSEPHQVSAGETDDGTWLRRLQMAEGQRDEFRAEANRLADRNARIAKDRDEWRDKFAELMTAVEVFLSAHTSERQDRLLQGLREAVVKGGSRWRL